MPDTYDAESGYLIVSQVISSDIEKMTQAHTKRAESDISERSIEQWDDEGGSVERVYGPVTTVLQYGPTLPLFGDACEPAELTFAEEEQILERLGAAVTMKWETLPRKIQRELFDYATSLADAIDTVQFTGQVARFLHDHKGSAFGHIAKN